MTRGVLSFLRHNTIALIALFIALGGTAYAATALPANSVGTTQLKNRAVTGAKVANNTITGAKVLESSLGKVPLAVKANSLRAVTWSNLTLESGWTAYGSQYGTPSYTKDAQGFVHLSGALDGSLSTPGAALATLPAGFRPTRAHYTWLRASATNGSFDPVVVDIEIDGTTGTITVSQEAAANLAFVSLEGISFYAN